MKFRRPLIAAFLAALLIAGSALRFGDLLRSWDKSIVREVGTGLERYAEILALLARSQSVQQWNLRDLAAVGTLFDQVVLREKALEGLYLVDADRIVIGRNTRNYDGLYINQEDGIDPSNLKGSERTLASGKFGEILVMRVDDRTLQLHKNVYLQQIGSGTRPGRISCTNIC